MIGVLSILKLYPTSIIYFPPLSLFHPSICRLSLVLFTHYIGVLLIVLSLVGLFLLSLVVSFVSIAVVSKSIHSFKREHFLLKSIHFEPSTLGCESVVFCAFPSQKMERKGSVDPKQLLAEEVSQWAKREFNLPSSNSQPSAIPPTEELKNICRGNMIPIWNFLVANVKNTK